MQTEILSSKVTSLFKDNEINEILINSNRSLSLYYKDGRKNRIAPLLKCSRELTKEMIYFASSQGKRLDYLSPSANGEYSCVEQGKFRWHCVIPPVSTDGPIASFRRHRFATIELDDFANSQNHLKQIKLAAESGHPVFINGATGSGKTSLLTSLIKKYFQGDRVAVLEKESEVPICSNEWFRLRSRDPNIEGKGRYSLDQAMADILRLRPDRIVIGEIRLEEAEALYQAMLSGHGGIWTTIHSDSKEGILNKLCFLTKNSSCDWNKWFKRYNPFFIHLERGTPPEIRNTEFWGH